MMYDWCKILKDAEGMGWYHCNSGGGVGPGNRSSRERSSTVQHRFGGNWAAEEMDSIYIQPGSPHSHFVVTLFSSWLLQIVDHLCHDEQLQLSNRGFFAATLEVWTIIHKAQALECERSHYAFLTFRGATTVANSLHGWTALFLLILHSCCCCWN